MGEVRALWTSVVLALCVVGLVLVVPFLVLQGFLRSVPVFGTSSHDGDGYLTWAAWLGAGLPLIGVVVAALGRRRGWTWFFALCLLVAAAVAGAKWVDDVRHAPPPPPEPRHCVEHSGGGTECPGG